MNPTDVRDRQLRKADKLKGSKPADHGLEIDRLGKAPLHLQRRPTPQVSTRALRNESAAIREARKIMFDEPTQRNDRQLQENEKSFGHTISARRAGGH
jgi:hypothetical protein